MEIKIESDREEGGAEEELELVERNQSRARADYFLPLSVLVSGILISGSIIYMVAAQRSGQGGAVWNPNTQGQAAAPSASGKSVMDLRSSDVILGSQNAPVTLVEYGDYQCPFCVRFSQQTEPLLRQSDIKSGNVRMIYRAFSFLGPESTAAAGAAECAKDQGKFWAYHDSLYAAEAADEKENPSSAENNGSFNRALFLQLASQVGLNVGNFTVCLDNHKYQTQVAADSQDAAAMGVNSTPTLFINGQKVLGAVPYSGTAGLSPGMSPLTTLIQRALKSK